MKSLRAAWRLARIFAVGVAGVALQGLIAGGLKLKKSGFGRSDTVFGLTDRVVAPAMHRKFREILNIRVIDHGQPVAGKAIFAPNHLSHLDPIINGGSIENRVFVAKDEVRQIPVVGAAIASFNTVFTKRRSGDSADYHAALRSALDKNFRINVYTQGTTTDGRDVPVFRKNTYTMFFNQQAGDNALLKDGVLVQPVALRVAEINGQAVGPDDQDLRDVYAAYTRTDGKTEPAMLKHLWDVLNADSMVIEQTFCVPVNPRDYLFSGETREKDAENCANAVRKAVCAHAAPWAMDWPVRVAPIPGHKPRAS